MGARGPVPARSDQRRRRNKPGSDEPETVSAPGAVVVLRPEAEPGWHPIATRWYESLDASGQSAFYEPSDWATAVYVAEMMSRSLRSRRVSAQLFVGVMSASSNLLVTEGDRRRVRLELQRAAGGEEDPDAAAGANAVEQWLADVTPGV